MTTKNEKEITNDQTHVWWDENWALKDRARINREKPISANDMKGWINKALEKGVQTRFWYLKTDVVMRIKSLVLRDERWEDLMYLGKRVGIIRGELGDLLGGQIIQEAVVEAETELAKDGMTHKDVKAKLEKLIKQTGETPVF